MKTMRWLTPAMFLGAVGCSVGASSGGSDVEPADLAVEPEVEFAGTPKPPSTGTTGKLTVTSAFMQGASFYAVGSGAGRNATITLGGVAVGKADAAGVWSFNVRPYLPATDCIARFGSGTATATRAITDCNFSATLTPSYLTLNVRSPMWMGDGCSASVSLPAYTAQPYPADWVPRWTSGMPTDFPLTPSAFTDLTQQCSPTGSKFYRTVSVGVAVGSKSETKDILIVPDITAWSAPATPFSVTAQSQPFCRPNVADGQDVTYNNMAIQDLREGYIGGGTVGRNPGVEFISAATLAGRCSRTFPNGYAVTPNGAATVTTTVVGANKCVEAKQVWSCAAGTTRAALSKLHIDGPAFDGWTPSNLWLAQPAPAGGVTVTMAYTGGITGPASVFVPAGASNAPFSAQWTANGTIRATLGIQNITRPVVSAFAN